MSGRLKLAAQGLSVALVAGLFALLVWKVATQDEGAATQARPRRGRQRAELPARPPRRRGEDLARRVPRPPGRRQLLGLLVRSVQGGGAGARGDLAALPGSRARRARRRLPRSQGRGETFRARERHELPACLRRAGDDHHRLRRRGRAGDVLRRAGREARLRAAPRRRPHRAKPGPLRRLRSGVARRREIPARGCRRTGPRRPRRRGLPDARRPRGRGDVPAVQDDARPVGRAGRARHQALHRDAGRRPASPRAQIKDELVAQFGPAVLAAPPREGFHWLAWLLPLAGTRSRAPS